MNGRLPKKRTVFKDLAILGKRVCFGEECLVSEEGEYQFNIICLSPEVHVWVLEKNSIVRNMPDMIKE